jgi:hypothetical protein
MVIDAKRVTELCVKFEITATELYFLYLVATRDMNNLHKYVRKVEGFNDKFRAKLEKKELLLDYNKTSDVDEAGDRVVKASLLYTTPKFDEALNDGEEITEIARAYEELLDAYPWEFTTEIGGKRFNARTGMFERNQEKYLKLLGSNLQLHKEILEITKYGKENDLIKFGIEKYIDGRLWGVIKQQMEKGYGGFTSDLE